MDKHLPGRRDFLTGAAAVATAALGADRALAQAAPAAAPPPTGPRLTMHAIDVFNGRPGAGMVTDLSIWKADAFEKIKTVVSSPNGRPPEPLLSGDALVPGRYELLLHFDDYFAKLGVKLPDMPFLTKAFVRFQIVDAKQAYHVPVLFSPWAYSFYRGS
jgi:5-hydroxyisourate hydrolase